jgi:vancomycin resistance protein YoaR
MIASLVRERDEQKRRADEQQQRSRELQVKNQELQVENLRLQLQLERYQKWYYGPRADRLSSGELAQMLLEFAEGLERKPVRSDDLPPHAEPGAPGRRVERRKGRRALADFEHLPVTTRV